MSFYVQLLAEPGLYRSIGDHYRITYQSPAGRISAGFYLHSPEASAVQLTAYSRTYFMDPKDKTLRIQLLCKNTSMQSAQFSFQVISFPQGLLPVNQQQIHQLAPGGQQLIELTVQNGQQYMAATDYYLDIQAIDQNDPKKRSLGLQRIKVVQLGSNKRWDNPGYMDSRLMEHKLAYRYTQSGNNYTYNHLQAEGNTPVLGSNNLAYRFNYNGYVKPVAGNEIYDSYLKWSRPGFDLKVGSINENMDYGLYGQGVSSSVDWSGPGSLTALYVKRSYLIYSDLYSQLSQEKDMAIQYKWDPARRRSDSSKTASAVPEKQGFLGPFELHYIHGEDPVTMTVRHIISGQVDLKPGRHQYLSLEAGASREYFQPDGSTHHKDGWSAGIHYNGNWDRLNLSLDNYASTPYYGGLRRGSVLLNETLSLSLTNGWLTSWQYNRQKNAPSYMGNYYAYISPETDRQQYGWAVAKNSSSWSVHFKPYYLEQSLHHQFMGNPVAFNSSGIRGELTVIKRGTESQMTLTSDVGWASTDNPYMDGEHYGSWRLMGSYNYGILSFNGVLQNGPLYIMEEAAPWQYSGYQNYSFGPSVNWVAASNKVKLQASDYLNYNGFQKQWSHNLSAAGVYQITRDIQLQADVHVNAYSDKLYKDFVQFSLGVQKTFQRTNGPGRHSWRLYFFEDLNADGRWDKKESAISGVIAQIKNVQVKSAVNGKVVLTDLPEGTYQLQLVDGKGWSLNKEVSIGLTRNAKTYIGLIRDIIVTGRLLADTTALTGRRANIEGVQVMAKEIHTGRMYTTFSNISGSFMFQLPKGEYIYTIPGPNSAFSVKEDAVRRTITNDTVPPVLFHIEDRSRAVDIQEF